MTRRLVGAVFEARRLLFVAKLRLLAFVNRAHLDLDIARGVRIEGRLLVRVHAGTHSTVRIGTGTRLGDGVRLVLDGGTLDIGQRALIRLGVVFHVRGDLILEDETLLSYYSIVHCDESVHLSYRVGLGEHTTIVDSTHITPPEGEWFYRHFETAPVHVGRDVWGGAKVTIGRGVRVGARSVIAAGSVVTHDVPSRSLVGGTPARVLGPSPLYPPPGSRDYPTPGQG